MLESAKFSKLSLRFGLAFVFIWFGADKFIHPGYWANAWVPEWFANYLTLFGLTEPRFVYLDGVFEILVGLSLLTDLFVKFFVWLAVLFLVAVVLVNGLTEVIVRDIGLIGGLLAVLFWPRQRDRF